jgi:NAD(P)-dependent dehydrogenase (short-subunit alcohol dehydrogenase family)
VDLNLKGRVAVAAGGANGAGREIALALVGEGAAVAVNHRSSGDAAKAVVGESEAEGV